VSSTALMHWREPPRTGSTRTHSPPCTRERVDGGTAVVAAFADSTAEGQAGHRDKCVGVFRRPESRRTSPHQPTPAPGGGGDGVEGQGIAPVCAVVRIREGPPASSPERQGLWGRIPVGFAPQSRPIHRGHLRRSVGRPTEPSRSVGESSLPSRRRSPTVGQSGPGCPSRPGAHFGGGDDRQGVQPTPARYRRASSSPQNDHIAIAEGPTPSRPSRRLPQPSATASRPSTGRSSATPSRTALPPVVTHDQAQLRRHHPTEPKIRGSEPLRTLLCEKLTE
jgi:hypothetical protein